MISALTLLGSFSSSVGARGEHAVGIVRSVDVDAVGQQDRTFHVAEKRRAVGLDSRGDVDRAGLERGHHVAHRVHVADGHVLVGDAVLLQPVVGQHFERVVLEGSERLALELGGRVEARLGDDVDALDAAAGDDLDRRAGVVEGHEVRVGQHADVDLPGAEEGDLIGEGRSIDEFERQAVVLGELTRVGDEERDVAKAVAVGSLDGRGGVGRTGQTHHPAGTAIVIVPSALAFRNDRRFSTLLVRPVKSWPP